MIKVAICSLGLALTTAVSGCGSSSAGSCPTFVMIKDPTDPNAPPKQGIITGCTDYTEGDTTIQAKLSCTGIAGTYSVDACPSVDPGDANRVRVGRCIVSLSSGSASASRTENYYPPTTAADAMQACTPSSNPRITVTFMPN